MHPIHSSPLQPTKRRRLVRSAVLGLLACAAVLAARAGSRETRLQLTQHKTVSRTSVPVVQDDLDILVDLARNDMATRLGIRPKEIALESTEPLSFPSARAGVAGTPPGYTIHLTARGQVYEYAGRPLGDAYVLWREIQ